MMYSNAIPTLSLGPADSQKARMPGERTHSVDRATRSDEAFDTPHKRTDHASVEHRQTLAAQVKAWRDARARTALEAPEMEVVVMPGPFDLFHANAASPAPQQIQDDAQPARDAPVQPLVALPQDAAAPQAGPPPGGQAQAGLAQGSLPQPSPTQDELLSNAAYQAGLQRAALPEAPLPDATQGEAAAKGGIRPWEMLSTAPMTGTQPQPTDQIKDAPQETAQTRNALAQAGGMSTETPSGEAGTQTLAKPFDLFHSVPLARLADTVDPMAVSTTLQQSLMEMATRLLVSDGSTGQRRVQIEVAEEQLPGVVVDVFEEEGRLVTRFTCSDESSRERLSSGAAWLADSLVERLQRDSRVQVQTDDPEDPCMLQVDANV